MKTNKTKSISLIIISILILLVILIMSIYLINKLLIKNNNEDIKNTTSISVVNNKIYGTVNYVGKGYVIVDPIDEEMGGQIEIQTNDDLVLGDFIVIYNNGDIQETYPARLTDCTYEVIANKEEINLVEDNVTTTKKIASTLTTTGVKTTNVATTKKQVNSTKTTQITTTVTTVNIESDEIVSYAKEANSRVSGYSLNETNKNTAKDYFVTLVDFIFYGGTIKGKTFNELSTAAKVKVIYYTLLLDSKVDSKWPNYKDTLSEKYNDVKAKLIGKFLDFTASVCENDEATCNQAKDDFAVLKASLNITWDVLKTVGSLVSSGASSLISRLAAWYEVWRIS